MKKRVCIFCGANTGNSNRIVNQALLLCDLLTRSGYGLVYGGGGKGLMGLIADRFLANGAEVIGVRPRMLIENEETHSDITKLIVVESMQERKSKFIELSDVFIALPGGIGTLDEIVETFTLHKIGFINKQSGILNTDGFYDNLIGQLEEMSISGFLNIEEKAMLKIANNPRDLIQILDIKETEIDTKSEIDKIAFIDIKNEKILVSKSFGKSKYYIPGGKREDDETDEEALIREVFEELSVRIEPDSIRYFGTFSAQADGKESGVDVRMTCYEGNYSETLEASCEIEKIDWFDSGDTNLIAEVDKKIFTYLKANNRIR